MTLALQENPDRVLDILAPVNELVPYLKLASSIAVHLVPSTVPDAPPLDVLRALALGWSPGSNLACRWLKGESLPDHELERLCLGNVSPQPIQVLQGIAAIFQYRTPVVICCDQLELAYIKAPQKVLDITARLMSILEKVPNHVLIISCLEAEWDKKILGTKGFVDYAFTSFKQRTYDPPLKLDSLKEEQAMELVAQRLESWQPASARPGRLWPFDDASLLTYVREKVPTPRWLIQQCDLHFKAWLEAGQQGVIYFATGEDVISPSQQFLRLWNAELGRIQTDSQFCIEDYSVERLQRAIREALCLAQQSLREMSGLRVRNIKDDVVKQVKAGAGGEKRYSFAVEVETAAVKGEVVVPVTDLNNSRRFSHYLDAVTEQIAGNRVGTLLVHRLSEFEMGPKTRDAYDQEIKADRIRLFAMEDYPQTLERLECLLRFLDRAGGRELQIGNQTLTVTQCHSLILETAVLDNLDLFKALGGWKKVQLAPKPAVVPSPPSVPPSPPAAPPLAVPVAAAVSVAPAPATKPVVPAVSASLLAVAVTSPSPPVPPPPADVQTRYADWAQGKLAELVKKLTIWGQPVRSEGVEIGPAFARLKVVPSGSKTTINRIRDKAEDVKIHLGLGVIPLIDSQASYVSVDVQLPERRVVQLAEVLTKGKEAGTKAPAFPLGLDVSGGAHWLDLSDTSDCHLLVAGQTGSGKSEVLRAMVAALARRLSPGQLKFLLIDPKQVTFNLGTLESPYLHAPVALGTEAALPLLQWCQDETRRRYELLAEKKKTNVSELEDESLVPRIVVIIDEFANLLEEKQTKAILNSVLRQIGSMSRAAGIHLVLATQRPDKDVVTPLLRDNLPGRIGLQVKTESSSKLILGVGNAAYLLGKGDLLWQHGGGLVRLQSPLITQQELEQALRAH